MEDFGTTSAWVSIYPLLIFSVRWPTILSSYSSHLFVCIPKTYIYTSCNRWWSTCLRVICFSIDRVEMREKGRVGHSDGGGRGVTKILNWSSWNTVDVIDTKINKSRLKTEELNTTQLIIQGLVYFTFLSVFLLYNWV